LQMRTWMMSAFLSGGGCTKIRGGTPDRNLAAVRDEQGV
jgi:hypothetical protein